MKQFFSFVFISAWAYASLADQVTTYSGVPAQMPSRCEQDIAKELSKDGEDTYLYESENDTFEDLMTAIKDSWSYDASAPVFEYDVCGSSNYFIIIVDKNTCSILYLDSGDSDGEC